MNTQSFLLNAICMVILWQDYHGKGNLRKSYCSTAGEKVSNWECLFVHREKGLFFAVYVDDIKLAGKKQNIDPMWKVLNKQVELEEPTSFLDHVYLGCTQRQCETSKDIVDNRTTMFEYTISAGATEKLPSSDNEHFYVVLQHGRLWCLVVEVLHLSSNQKKSSCSNGASCHPAKHQRRNSATRRILNDILNCRMLMLFPQT